LFSAGIAALAIAFALELQAVPAISVSKTIEPEGFEPWASLESQNLDSSNSFDKRFANAFDWPSRRQSAEREELTKDILLLPPEMVEHTSAPPPVPLAQSASRFTQTGIASVYSVSSGSRTASGTHLNPGALTAAHRTLAFGTTARVINQHNGRSVIVTINDRGPFVPGRIIDLNRSAARVIGLSGIAPVIVEVSN
jgi:rare lipoprotein A